MSETPVCGEAGASHGHTEAGHDDAEPSRDAEARHAEARHAEARHVGPAVPPIDPDNDLMADREGWKHAVRAYRREGDRMRATAAQR